MSGEAGQAYQVAASFNTRPGIRTPAGTIHLTPDGLFFLSLANPYLFPRFSGVLDSAGKARPAVRIPAIPVLRGLRFFLAAVSYDANGFRQISEPMGVTLE